MKQNKIAIIGLTGQSIFLNINEFHKDGETKQANSLYIEPGGKGYNQAVALKKLGSDVYFLTAVGNDDYGQICEKEMLKMGINTYYVKKDVNTALATIITNDNGDNQVTVFKGASELLSLDDLNSFKQIIKKCDILLIQNEVPYEIVKEAIIYASKNNVLVVYNPAPAIFNIQELLPYINILIPNESESFAIYNNTKDNIIINNDLKLIITEGSKGCTYIDKNRKESFTSLKVKAVDTTGAGDVFCAAVCSFINQGYSIDEVIKLATIASGIHVQKKYVIDAIPSVNEVLDIYNKKEA